MIGETLGRQLLRMLLQQWASGALTAQEVHEEAEALWERRSWPVVAEDDPDSIAIEVLSQLDLLNQQFITTDDIPALLAFLATPPEQTQAGWHQWRAYWDGVDFETRRRILANTPPYGVAMQPDQET